MDSFESQDELERLKAWWKRYGTAVVYGVVIGVALLVGVNLWRNYETGRAEASSMLYEELVGGVERQQWEAAEAAGARLMEDYAGTPYAGKAALYLAKISYGRGDGASARAQLQWAIDNAGEPAVRHAARLRLGRILLADGEPEAALTLTQAPDQTGFESQYHELRGDALVRLGRAGEARGAYRQALDTLLPGSSYAPILQAKLDDLGPEQAL